MTELYIFNQDDKLLTIITEDTGLVDTHYRIEVNSVPDTPFSFTVEADSENAQYVKDENKVVYRDHEGDLRLVVIKELDDSDSIDGPLTTATCEPEFMELQENIIVDRRFTERTTQFMLDAALENTRYVGEVEVDLGLGSTNFYYLTSVEAIWKIIEVMGGEVKDVVEFDEENNIIARKIKILQRLGKDIGQRFEIDHNITEIGRTVLSYPKTAMYGRGASLEIEDDQGEHTGGYTRYIDFADVEWRVSRGDPVDKPLGQRWVGDPDALQVYGRPHNGDKLHRYGIFSNQDYEDPADLLWATWEHLQQNKRPEVNYRLSVDLFDDKVSLGDTAIAIDRYFARPIEIQARIIAMEYDLLDINGTMIVEMGQFLDLEDNRLDEVINEVERIRSRPARVTESSFPNRIPPVPANIRVEDGYNDIQLYWDYPDVIYIKHYEVYGSQVQGFVPDSQHLLGRTSTAAFHHRATVDQKWYFRIRAVNHHGRASDYSPEVSGSTVRIITDDILFGENVSEMLRRDMLIAEMIADDSITWDMVSETAKSRIQQDARDYTDEEISLVENSLMNQIADKAGFDYVDGQLQLKADQATVNDQISTVMQELADKASLTYVDGQLVDKVNVGTVYTISEIDNKFENVVSVTEYETDQQGIVQWMNATETRIEQTETDISSRVTRTEFNNLEIGVRNLVRNSNFTNGLDHFLVNQVNENSIGPDGLILDGYGSNPHIQPDMVFEPGVYTVQIWYNNIEGDVPYLWESGTSGDHTVSTSYPFEPGEGWKVAEVLFTVITPSLFRRIRYASNSPVGHTDGRTIIKAIKIERGNKRTDWTPAPEDVEGEVNNINQRITTAETAIIQNAEAINLRATKSELNAVDNSLAEAWSEINIQAGLIEQRVSQEEYQADQSGIVTRFENVESVQEQHAGLISQRVTQTTYNAGINQLNNLIESKAQEYKINFSFSSSTDYVILLCRADASGTSNFVVGTLTGRRVSGHVSSGKVEIVFNNSSAGTLPVGYIEATEIQSINRFEMVTCTFQGNSYIALRHRPNNEFRLWDTDARFYGQIGSSGEMLRPVQSSGVSNIQEFQSSQPVSSPITQAFTAIDQNATAINLRATKTEVNAIEDRLSQAESTLSVQAGQIEAKVDVDGIVSELNINREGIRIRGALIELDGDTLIQNGIIGTAAIANGAIERAKLGTAVIGTGQIENLAVTNAKIASINADKVNAVALSAITANLGTVNAGILMSQNNNTNFNLNTGILHMSNANITLGGGASISFESSGNGVRYQLSNRSAGMVLSTSAGYSSPFVGIGVSASTSSGGINASDSTFRGLRVHANNVDHNTNIIDHRIVFSELPDLSAGGFIFQSSFDGSSRRFIPMNTSGRSYSLGTNSNRWDEAYIENIYGSSSNGFHLRNPHGTAGWRFDLQADSGATTVTFRGLSTGTWSYNLGSSGFRMNSIFLRNDPNVSSDSRLKEDILDNVLGLDFINAIETKTFRLKQTNADADRNKMQYGIIAQQLVEVLQGVGVDTNDISLVNRGEDGMYGVQKTQLIAPTIKAVQELSAYSKEEINWLKIENQLLKARVAKLEQQIA